ncbi:MAG: Cof-type HAD-IIB family hydrolase [Lachnospiraceae bacterium]|jgi:Cof subfamily protein (haloacid dehalogenase superfamily)|nr:Cof-type HAD-IIB family hydrolase [Lachnospiraceae bacterium]
MIKVIACDMDGTLLGKDSVFANETIRAVNRATDAGIKFIIVSGRTKGGVKPVINSSKIVTDFILCNGAVVLDKEYNYINEYGIDPEKAKDIYRFIKDRVYAIRLYSRDYDYMIDDGRDMIEVLATQLHIFMPSYSYEDFKKTDYFNERLALTKVLPDMSMFDNYKEFPLYKMYAYNPDESEIFKLKQDLKKRYDLSFVSSFLSNVEVTSKNASKGPVLQEYIESLGYSMREVAVFGDSENDASMLKMDFGMTFAMKNASDDIKKMTKYVTEFSNVENGVAYEIEKIIANN